MIEQERRSTYSDSTPETERWLKEISEAGRKRARYQEMAAEGLIDFEELRARLSALEETRKIAERKVRTLQHHTECLKKLKRDRDNLLESYSGLIPEVIDTLGSEERHQIYKMIHMKAYLKAEGSLELSGDVMNFSNLVILPT